MAVAEYRVAEPRRVLVVSSDAAFRTKWIGLPSHRNRDMDEAIGGADALAKLEAESWSEVLLDSKLHDLDIDEVIRTIHVRHPHVEVRVLDSEYENETPRVDAADGNRVQEQLFEMSGGHLRVVGVGLREISPLTVEPLPGMVYTGAGLEDVFRLARLVGPRRTPVLITGETGTGKELIARGIHAISPRVRGPFVVVNCAAIPETLLEAELFGHARGAFTGAVQTRLGRLHAAHGGTLLLDEVGELPASMQAKLLRFLQDGEVQRLGSSDIFRVDVRVISATNVDLLRSVQQGTFRRDLYYRLAVFPLELPPLRHRKEQIVPLTQLFLNALCEQSGVAPKGISAAAARVLRQHSWPGNVRELQHAVERAFILSEDSPQLCLAHFSFPDKAA